LAAVIGEKGKGKKKEKECRPADRSHGGEGGISPVAGCGIFALSEAWEKRGKDGGKKEKEK